MTAAHASLHDPGAEDLLRPPSPLDPFIPVADVRERHAVLVHAPADVVYEVATHFDMQSLALVRGIVALRAAFLRGHRAKRQWRGLVEETRALGWARLAETPGRRYVSGAQCQPWVGDVVFTPIPAAAFRAAAAPDHVKIGWTLETTPIAPGVTWLATETRAVAADDAARRRFLRYWRFTRAGVVAIRWLLLPAIRRESERRWRAILGPVAAPRASA